MKKYIIMVLDFLFGCHHNNMSRVFTISSHTYCVCCDCGKEFDYSLRTMSVTLSSPSTLNAPWKDRYADGQA
jgi:hypothetical protein